MAETVTIDESLLYPGDTIRFDFVLKASNQTLLDAAIKKVKEQIYSDDRLDAQGSEIVTEVDKSGLEGSVQEIQVLRIYATVRKYRREQRAETQYAVAWVPILTLVGLVTAAVVAWSGAIAYRSYTVQRIALSAESDTVKVQAMGALQQPTVELSKIGVGTVAIGALFLWALFGHRRRGGGNVD